MCIRDRFTCGDSVDPWISYKYLEEALKAGHGSSMELLRGQEKLLTRKDIEAIKRDQIEQRKVNQLLSVMCGLLKEMRM